MRWNSLFNNTLLLKLGEKERKILWAAAAVIVLGTGVFFRLYPITVYPHLAAKNDAQLVVYSQVRKSVERSVEAANPGIPSDQKKQLVDGKYQSVLKNYAGKVEGFVNAAARRIYEERKATRPFYLLEVDPYYYLALTRQVLETGRLAEKRRGIEYFNPKMLAPSGAWYPLDYHAYTGAVLHKVLGLFPPKRSLVEAVSLVPLVLAGLSLLPFFLFCGRILRLSPLSSLLGGLVFSLSPAALKRSLYGWYDTDPYNLFFPAAIFFCLFYALEKNRETPVKKYWVALPIAATAVYSLFWRGWALVFALCFASLFLASVIASFKEKKPVPFLFLLSYAAGPLLMVPVLWGFQGFLDVLKDAAEFGRGFFQPSFSLWPDVFLSVGELRPSRLPALFKLVGGGPIFLAALLGIFWQIRYALKKEKVSECYAAFFLAVFFLFTMLLAKRMERFTLLMVTPVAFGCALAAEHALVFFKTNFLLQKRGAVFLLGRFALKSAVVLGVLLLLLPSAHEEARQKHAIYNVSWDRMMTYLKEKTPENSIVTSWWPPGHFITSQADRSVTIDGATQNTPQAYWVARFFLESSEKKALGMLRMLNLSGNGAVAFLLDKGVPLSSAVEWLDRIFVLPKGEAEKTLRSILGQEETAELLALTHGEEELPPSYVFIYDDLVAQALGLQYIGKWDFKKAERFQAFVEENPGRTPKKLLRRASPENAKLMWAMAGGPWAQEREAYENRRDENFVYFPNGLILRKDFSDARIDSQTFGRGKPKSVFYLESGALREKAVKGGSLNLSVLVAREGARETYKSVLANENFIRSLLFRLYYLKGQGLSHFRLLAAEESIENRNRLYAFEVVWPDKS